MKLEARKFKAIVDEYALDDFGMSGSTFEVKSLTKGKIYSEHLEWNDRDKDNTSPSGHVVDDNGCWWMIGSEAFNNRFYPYRALTNIK